MKNKNIISDVKEIPRIINNFLIFILKIESILISRMNLPIGISVVCVGKVNKGMIEMELDHMDKLYYSKNPLVRYIHTKRLEIIKKIVENQKQKKYNKKKVADKILDCGCGEGHLLKKLQGRKYGIDLSDTALKRAKEKNPDAKFL